MFSLQSVVEPQQGQIERTEHQLKLCLSEAKNIPTKYKYLHTSWCVYYERSVDCRARHWSNFLGDSLKLFNYIQDFGMF